MKNDYYQRQIDLINSENDNISKNSDIKEFFVLLSKFIVLILVFMFIFDFIMGLCIDNLTPKQQHRIEKILKFVEPEVNVLKDTEKYTKDLYVVEKIKNEIKSRDSRIPSSAKIEVRVLDNKKFNAMICPNGRLYITKGVFEEKLTEQELAFILSHELGHYSHKDQLRSVSKKIAIMVLCIIFRKDDAVNSIVAHTSQLEFFHYSRTQEKNADLYASKMLIDMYGTNEAATKLFERYMTKKKVPLYKVYLSTHPPTRERHKYLRQAAK